jgi:DNA repair exonuclease SbcCD ATPase subunit
VLKQLTTKYFRKLVDRTFTFVPGLNVLRGPNEEGKTTMLEAIGYAWGGVKACRDPLAEVVTWGQPEKALKVELVHDYNGVVYTVTRSKAGAEVNYDGGRVVGQAEVTAFYERLFGCDMAMIGKLMMASQGSIRGALSAGPKATMELIEGLADFQVVDRLLEIMSEKLTTGPSAQLEERLTQAQAALATAQAASVKPDTVYLHAQCAGWTTGMAERQKKIDAALKPAYEAAQAEVQQAEVAAATRKSLQNQASGVFGNKARREAQRREALQNAEGAPTPAEIAVAREAVSAAQNVEMELAIYRQFENLKLPEIHWEGDEDSLQAEYEKAVAERAALRVSIAEIDQQIRTLRSSVHAKGDTCGSCGQKLPDAAAIAAHNAKVSATIAEATIRRANVVAADGVATYTANALLAVIKSAEPFNDFLARHGERVNYSEATWPPTLSWKGTVPSGSAGLAVLKEKLSALELAANTAYHAKAKAAALTEAIEQDVAEFERLTAEIVKLRIADELPELREKLEVAQDAYNAASGQISELRYKKEQAEDEILSLEEAYTRSRDAVAHAQAGAERAEKDLKDLAFNNALLKRVRAARPVIADKLWSLVLSTVSAYFSAMRGEKSVVTREGNTFKVDGRVVGGGSLSGSALDILGLALRVALTKTFLPNSPLLTLDEPAAACDDARTASTMGFLTAAGFAQTIVVTHEDATESVAQNLITL